MSETLQHECSVAALYWMDDAKSPEGEASRCVVEGDVTPLLVRMLGEMQNRGQLAAGVATFQESRAQRLKLYKNTGTVDEVFRTCRTQKFLRILEEYAGRAGIGHTRYATSGQDDARFAQPYERQHGRLWKWFCFAFNGTLANDVFLRNELLSQSEYYLSRDGDTEILQYMLARFLRGEDKPDLTRVMTQVCSQLDGAYNIVFLDGMGRLFASRGPQGIRPLCWGVQGRLFGVASESLALQNLGFREIHHFEPGTMALVDAGGFRFTRYAPTKPSARCFFEWIYFANAASEIDGQGVFPCRERCGRVLAECEDIPWDEDSMVVPVPDTAKSAAAGYAYEAGIPFREGLLRNRYAGRTFIQTADMRDYAVRSKYWVIPTVLQGKRVFLVDDSIVRSTTLRALARRLRNEGGVREIHVRVACPPILAPCFYGIDMSTVDELFAPQFLCPNEPVRREALDAMAADLGVDSLRYVPVERIPDCIGVPRETLCMGCLDSRYPTPCGQQLYDRILSDKKRNP